MFGISDYWAFVVAILLFLAIPGPANLLLISSTCKGGVRGGLTTLSGILLGDQVLLWLALAGVATLLASRPFVFHSAQWIGGAYLGWMGLRMLISKSRTTDSRPLHDKHFLREALLVTALNPKAIIFYMAFFPLFIDPRHTHGWSTSMAMAATIACLSFVYGIVTVLVADRLATRLRADSRLTEWLRRLAGTFLIGCGIKLILTR
ncbi:LysE family transporter [Burkholderia cenocepacia]|uniref:LysE family transporter n=1 Tax=Burkholderia cenocepacia TaxID=95486 RepID=UPI000846B39A|nr:LysE family transporter [Burkholderia cenocepacia]